jgi:hypothetical protein
MLELFIVIGSLFAWFLGVVAAFVLWGFRWGSLATLGLTALFWKQLFMVGVMGLMVFLAAKMQT